MYAEAKPMAIPKLKYFSIMLLILFVIFGNIAISQASGLEATQHIQVELFPAEKTLTGRNDITIKTNASEVLQFRLSERATQIVVEVNREPRNFSFIDDRLRLKLKPAELNNDVRVSILYAAKFDDAVPLRPVNMDNPGFGVTATISELGTFLLAGSGWYPKLAGSRTRYRVTVTAPVGLIAVTAGRSLGHRLKNGKTVSDWEVNHPVDGLSLSAARYTVEEKSVGDITVATYFLPQNRHLSAAYLEATARYLTDYSNLFGSYPFQKFAVVENFFPTGYGFPSYTLLGGNVLRLPFIIHTSLGHEIAHCWWGNGVYVDYTQGNWSEALTTYVADYRFKEMKSPQDASDHRRQWLKNYATLVAPQKDFALDRFQSRYDPVTRTIGYDKGAMVFHMVRQILGEEAFWGALQDIYRSRRFKRTSWSDLIKAFESRGKQSLQNFFDQWLSRPGAPQFFLNEVRAENADGTWKVMGQIKQVPPYYKLRLKLALQTREQTTNEQILVSGKATPFELVSDLPPQRLTADPDDNVFRRLWPSEIPPAVNALKGSASVITVVSENLEPEIIKTAETLMLSLGLKQNKLVAERELDLKMFPEHDILLIGLPQRNELWPKMPTRVRTRPDNFWLNEKLYDSPNDSFFGVFKHPVNPRRIVALFKPLSPQYADAVARKITHYGKYSYLAFQSSKNVEKGVWPAENSPLVYEWGQNREEHTGLDVPALRNPTS
jgi:hypothetical protein